MTGGRKFPGASGSLAADVDALKAQAHADDDVQSVSGTAVNLADPRNPKINLQTALQTAIADVAGQFSGENVEDALIQIKNELIGLFHTDITPDLVSTGVPNQYTVVLNWIDKDGVAQSTTDPTPITFIDNQLTVQVVEEGPNSTDADPTIVLKNTVGSDEVISNEFSLPNSADIHTQMSAWELFNSATLDKSSIYQEPSVIIGGETGGWSYLAYLKDVPAVLDRTVCIKWAIDTNATNTACLRLAGTVVDLVFNVVDGEVYPAGDDAAKVSIVSNVVSENIVTTVVKFSANAAHTGWHLYPDYGLSGQTGSNNSATGSFEIFKLDLNHVVSGSTNVVTNATGHYTIATHRPDPLVDTVTAFGDINTVTGTLISTGLDFRGMYDKFGGDAQFQIEFVDTTTGITWGWSKEVPLDSLVEAADRGAALDLYVPIYDNDWERINVFADGSGVIEVTDTGRDMSYRKSRITAAVTEQNATTPVENVGVVVVTTAWQNLGEANLVFTPEDGAIVTLEYNNGDRDSTVFYDFIAKSERKGFDNYGYELQITTGGQLQIRATETAGSNIVKAWYRLPLKAVAIQPDIQHINGSLNSLGDKLHTVVDMSTGSALDLSGNENNATTILGNPQPNGEGYMRMDGYTSIQLNTTTTEDNVWVFARVRYDDAMDTGNAVSFFSANVADATYIPLAQNSATSTELIRVGGVSNPEGIKFAIDGVLQEQFASRSEVFAAVAGDKFVNFEVHGISAGTTLFVGDNLANAGFDFVGDLHRYVVLDKKPTDAEVSVINAWLDGGAHYTPVKQISKLELFRAVAAGDNTTVQPAGYGLMPLDLAIYSVDVKDTPASITYDAALGELTVVSSANYPTRLEANFETVSSTGNTTTRTYYFRDKAGPTSTPFGEFGRFGLGTYQYSAFATVPAGETMVLDVISSSSGNNQRIKGGSYIRAFVVVDDVDLFKASMRPLAERNYLSANTLNATQDINANADIVFSSSRNDTGWDSTDSVRQFIGTPDRVRINMNLYVVATSTGQRQGPVVDLYRNGVLIARSASYIRYVSGSNEDSITISHVDWEPGIDPIYTLKCIQAAVGGTVVTTVSSLSLEAMVLG